MLMLLLTSHYYSMSIIKHLHSTVTFAISDIFMLLINMFFLHLKELPLAFKSKQNKSRRVMMNFLIFWLSGKFSLSFSPKARWTQNSTLDWQFFPFSTLNISAHSLLVYHFCWETCYFLICFFYLSALNFLPFSLNFSSLIKISLYSKENYRKLWKERARNLFGFHRPSIFLSLDVCIFPTFGIFLPLFL